MKTSNLLFALKLAQPCIVSIDLVPVLQHFCFEPGQLFSYDEVSAIIVAFDSDLHCALRANALLPLLQLSGEEVTLTHKAGTTVFVSGTTKVELPTLPPEHFAYEEPRLRDRNALLFSLTEEFLSALRLCAAGVSKDPRFRARTAVTLRTGKEPALYASDGTSLIKVALTGKLGEEERIVLIPKSVCDQIVGLAEMLACSPADVGVCFNRDTLVAMFGQTKEAIKEVGKWDVRLVGKLLADDNEVKDFEEAISEGVNKKVVPVSDDFYNAVDKVAIVTSGDVEKVCNLEFTKEGLVVHGRGSLGSARTVLVGTGNTAAAVDPEHLVRYRDKMTHVSIDKQGVVMCDSKTAAKAKLSYVIACFD